MFSQKLVFKILHIRQKEEYIYTSRRGEKLNSKGDLQKEKAKKKKKDRMMYATKCDHFL